MAYHKSHTYALNFVMVKCFPLLTSTRSAAIGMVWIHLWITQIGSFSHLTEITPMPLTINFKEIQAVVIVGPLAELNCDLFSQHLTCNVVRLMLDQLPECFSPSEAVTDSDLSTPDC
ncbi:hypothetical protein VP01_339g9 [Puccinia sorghi]|uniref:Uncharacterized protein n=1 Tax=Puccinia sorghi TaxID=27349 RepID=A0A0L6UXJ0_9BASI|nr:hypothetical protein VP01_339g9 [Puccinia sorghi]